MVFKKEKISVNQYAVNGTVIFTTSNKLTGLGFPHKANRVENYRTAWAHVFLSRTLSKKWTPLPNESNGAKS